MENVKKKRLIDLDMIKNIITATNTGRLEGSAN